ncbi:MAG: phosphopyruvate hydratase [Gammaproteobacteria bacterium]|nr:phosphopyruvate hydratase [Gammaproteobacteria bacterium]
MLIQQLKAREILDSRGQPTVEVDVILKDGNMGRASVPSGASTGKFEALEWRDQEVNRYFGKGVRGAVKHVETDLQSLLVGTSVESQEVLDERMIACDGTEDKSRLGANAILAVSLAAARARANSLKLPLFLSLKGELPLLMPVPMLNILNGGAHANNNLDIQEFMVMPIGALDIAQALEMSQAVMMNLKKLLQKNGLSTAVGDEGGFAPNLTSHEQALDFIMQAMEISGLRAGRDMVLSLDVASSEWFENGKYHLPKANQYLTAEELIQFYQKLCKHYPIVSIEDGLAETDWAGWKELTHALGQSTQLVGDDLFVTNPKRLAQGIDTGTANAILIKLNQIGTLSETLETMRMAHLAGYRAVMSHRSGETEDSFIADLAVATGCGQIKTGSLCRTDRICKYNQLLRIAEMQTIPYAGSILFKS